MNIRNIILFIACALIVVQTLSGKEPNVQSLTNECEAKGIEKQKAEALINSYRQRNQELINALMSSNITEVIKTESEGIKTLDAFSSNKLARPITLGFWSPSPKVKKAALDQLLKLKDPGVTDIVIQALEDNVHVKSGIETIPQSAFVYELVNLLNRLTGSNYQLNFDHSDESQRAAIVKAAKEILGKQKEM
ncbi:MAG: hypothetical protein PHW60_01740 [Kiritimatiellae bacterium]|nr:hypothetical protein [Kiritimatiellia bacterium]